MSRPSAAVARQRRIALAHLVAHDIAAGGLEQAHRNIVGHVKACAIDPWRALRLAYDPAFVADVETLVEREAA